MSPHTEPSLRSADSTKEGGGASGVSDIARVDRLAPFLAERGGLPVASAAAEFARLLELPGDSLYLQIVASAPGATLTLQRRAVDRAMLCVPSAFCCGAGRPEHPPAHGYVMVLWAQSAVYTHYEATCPVNVEHIALVVNGRLVALTLEDLPVTLDLTA